MRQELDSDDDDCIDLAGFGFRPKADRRKLRRRKRPKGAVLSDRSADNYGSSYVWMIREMNMAELCYAADNLLPLFTSDGD